jgi:4-hydroxy-tetrahydrodipicolinate reductase
MINVAVHGAQGRMGTHVCECVAADARFALAAAIGRENAVSSDDLTQVPCDVIIDFSTPEGAVQAAHLARARGIALVVGTTGLSAQNFGVMDDVARSVPVMIAPNTSLGVAVLTHLVCEAARLLPASFDVDLVDAHHARKRDAPSGTALRLIERMQADAGVEIPAARVHCMRRGDVVGEHTIFFSGPGESLQISHAAIDRSLFARGALQAAEWLYRQPPGRYSIEQALGLTTA